MFNPCKILGILLVAVAIHLRACNSSKILMPGPLMRGRGHTTLLSALCKELTSRGHEVTILVPSDNHLKVGAKFANSNATEILEYDTVPMNESEVTKSIRAGNKTNAGVWDSYVLFSEVLSEQYIYCRQLLSNDEIITRLRQSKFDLLIADMTNVCDGLLPEVLQLPHIALTAVAESTMANYNKYGFPLESSYFMSPIVVPSDGTNPSLYTRAINVIVKSVLIPLTHFVCSIQWKPLQVEFNIRPDLDVTTLGHRSQFWLAHDSYMLEAPHPEMPNWCHVGGMAAARTNPLPQDFAEFADGSGDAGFIVFSLGSIVAGLDAEFTELVGSVLKRMPQRVFWKTDHISADIGDNIKVTSWLPQIDLLAHPKARLFIGHGGLGGIYEALYHGVPMVLIPQMHGFQRLAAQRAVNRGYGLLLHKKDLTAETFEHHINHILSNANFSENTRRCSQILQDDDPMDRAVYWVEHIIKFGGGYRRAEVFNLSFIQYYLLDVYASLILVFFISALTVYFGCVLCCRLGRRCVTSITSTDKNCKVD